MAPRTTAYGDARSMALRTTAYGGARPLKAPRPTRCPPAQWRREPQLTECHQWRREQAYGDTYSLNANHSLRVSSLRRRPPAQWRRTQLTENARSMAPRTRAWGRLKSPPPANPPPLRPFPTPAGRLASAACTSLRTRKKVRKWGPTRQVSKRRRRRPPQAGCRGAAPAGGTGGVPLYPKRWRVGRWDNGVTPSQTLR